MNSRRRAIMGIQGWKKSTLSDIAQWNQLHPMGNRTWGSGLTGVYDATTNTVTITGTSTATVTQPLYPAGVTLNYISNHRYLLFPRGFQKGATLMYNGRTGDNTTSPKIVLGSSISTDYPRFRCNSGINFGEGITVQVQVFDLTVIFGVGNEPTIAEFNALFPNDYYADKTATGNTDGATKYEYQIVDAQNEIYKYKEIK